MAETVLVPPEHTVPTAFTRAQSKDSDISSKVKTSRPSGRE